MDELTQEVKESVLKDIFEWAKKIGHYQTMEALNRYAAIKGLKLML